MMYSVLDILNQRELSSTKIVSVYGYIVIRDEQLVLLNASYEHSDWKKTPYVALVDSDIKYAMMDQFPTRAGGVSIFFDQCVVDGSIIIKDNNIILNPMRILIRSNMDSLFKALNFDSKSIMLGKDKPYLKSDISDLW